MTTIREALVDLELQGRLTPRVIVQEAAEPTSPMHDYIYGPTDEEAIDRFRLDRARSLIRRYKIHFITDEGEHRSVRQFTSVHTNAGYAYLATEDIASNGPLGIKIMLQAMERDAATFKRRYSHMKEYTEFVRRMLDAS